MSDDFDDPATWGQLVQTRERLQDTREMADPLQAARDWLLSTRRTRVTPPRGFRYPVPEGTLVVGELPLPVRDGLRREVRAGRVSRAEAAAFLPGLQARRMLSGGWTARALFGAVWRQVMVMAGLALAGAAFVPSLTQLGVAAGLFVLPGLFVRRWRAVWRWTAASLVLAYALPGLFLYRYALIGLLTLTVPGGLMAARRWRISA